MTRTYCIAAMLFAATIASSCKRNRRSDEGDNPDRTYRMPTETAETPEKAREPRPRLDPVTPPARLQANPTAAENLGLDERTRTVGVVSAAGIAPGIPMTPGDAGLGEDAGVPRDAGGMRDGGTVPDAGGMREAGATGTTGATDTTGEPGVDETRPEPVVEDTTGDTTGSTSNGETTNPPQQ